MINITDKHNCCGCEACMQVCPKRCISFDEDEEGFRYPFVNKQSCIECGLCEKVCPVLHEGNPVRPIHVFAAKNISSKEVQDSSSGGIFIVLAKYVISKGGVVFGAKFNEKWDVEHSFAENEEGLNELIGSKYVQSNIGNSYIDAKKFLTENRFVLFSGMPCQIAGLMRFLGRRYDKLLTVEVLCHGVPSPKAWRKYLKDLTDNVRRKKNIVPYHSSLSSWNTKPSCGNEVKIKGISFRNKRMGWKKYSFVLSLSILSDDSKQNTVLFSQMHRDNAYMKGMLNNLFTRLICYQCPFRNQKSNSDFSLGDFWGIEKTDSRFADNEGTNMVLINSEHGLNIWEEVCDNIKFADKTYEEAIKVCSMIVKPVPMNEKRSVFFSLLSSNKQFHKIISKTISQDRLFKSKLKECMMETRIIVDSPGQTCNRFWSYLDSIAWAVVKKRRVFILWWDPSIKYYDNLRNNPYVIFPFYSKIIFKIIDERKYQKVLKKIFYNRPLRKIFQSKMAEKAGFVNGWKIRASFQYYPRVSDEIRKIYLPNENISESVDLDFAKYRDQGYFIIGVHIRWGDYRKWEGGKYYYTLKEYISVMNKVLSLYEDKNLLFFISSNEKLNIDDFRGYNVILTDYPTAAHDLYALSRCDRILGPLSTFSRWASFHGKVPLLFIDRNMNILSDSNFSIITDFYHFENGMEIPNLTDKKRV